MPNLPEALETARHSDDSARWALLINPVRKRYSVIPETALGIEPELLTRLLEDERFRKVWDVLPGADRTCPDAAQ